MATSAGHISGMVILVAIVCGYVVTKVLIGMWSHIYRAITEEKGRQ